MWLDRKTACEALGIHPDTLRRLVRLGHIRSRRSQRRRLYHRDDVEQERQARIRRALFRLKPEPKSQADPALTQAVCAMLDIPPRTLARLVASERIRLRASGNPAAPVWSYDAADVERERQERAAARARLIALLSRPVAARKPIVSEHSFPSFPLSERFG
jgi:excisionase family DNA binding protein